MQGAVAAAAPTTSNVARTPATIPRRAKVAVKINVSPTPDFSLRCCIWTDRYAVACPANFNCSSTGQHCVSKNGPGGPDCDDDDKNSSTTATVASATPSTAASTFSGPPVLAVASTTGSNTTTYTTTVTSTATNTVTISATTVACGLSAATTGLPITGSVVSYGNSTTVALNTTTSTMSVTNVTVHPATNYNLTKPTSSINPPISGYKGAASGLQGRSSTSLFALGALIFMAALLI